jgi:ubiquinone/menaquinone biosynthesis C-methylase UbiE
MKSTVKRNDGEEVECFYYPDVFSNVTDLEHAKQLTVTKEKDLTSEERWKVETKFAIDTFLKFVYLNKNSRVLDYGCGVGRLSKALIDRVDCSIVGVDISPRMRSLAMEYVNQSCFEACSSEELRTSVMSFDCAIAAWVLQHCAVPSMDIDLLAEVLKPKAHLLVLNSFSRTVPIKVPSDDTLCWMDDGINIQDLLLKYFIPIQHGEFPAELAPLNSGTYWAVYRRK